MRLDFLSKQSKSSERISNPKSKSKKWGFSGFFRSFSPILPTFGEGRPGGRKSYACRRRPAREVCDRMKKLLPFSVPALLSLRPLLPPSCCVASSCGTPWPCSKGPQLRMQLATSSVVWSPVRRSRLKLRVRRTNGRTDRQTVNCVALWPW